MKTGIRFKSLWRVAGSILAAIVLGVGIMVFGNPDNSNGIFTRDVIETPRTNDPLGPAAQSYERKEIKIQEEGRAHIFTYFWLEPHKPYPENLKFPLVVILHGSPGNAYAGQYIAQDEMQLAYPSFVLVPVIPAGTVWSFPATLPPGYEGMEAMTKSRHMLPYVVTMIRDAMSRYPIDPSRIYVMGCSQGGFGAFGAVRDYPDLFAAAVSISGGWSADDSLIIT
jgi:predicted peptidase